MLTKMWLEKIQCASSLKKKICSRVQNKMAQEITTTSQLVSGRRTANHVISLVSGAGGIFPTSPPQWTESTESIYFPE